MMYKEHPQNVVTRHIMLNYLNEVIKEHGISTVIEKLGTSKFVNIEIQDLDWQSLLFGSLLTEVEAFLEPLEDEIRAIAAKNEELEKAAQESQNMASINLRDFAQAKIDESKKLQI